jgi:hypothetical protein
MANDLPGGIMENTLDGAAGAPSSEHAAVQNAQSAASIVVGIPMLWGMMKALEDVPALISLFP